MVSAVQAALFVLRILPPPATGSGVFAFGDSPGTWGAADGGVPLRVQPVHRKAVLLRVVPDLRFGPVGQGIDLDESAVHYIDLDRGEGGAGRALLLAHPRDPPLQSCEGTAQRLDLADMAALVAVLEGFPERIRTLRPKQSFNVLVAREEPVDADPVTPGDPFSDLVGFLVESPGVQGEDADREFVLLDVVYDHEIFDGEGAGDLDIATCCFQTFFENFFDRGIIGKLRENSICCGVHQGPSKMFGACLAPACNLISRSDCGMEFCSILLCNVQWVKCMV